MKTFVAAAAAIAALCSPVLAEDSYFDGFYAGIYGSVGELGSGRTVFAGALAGYRLTVGESFILGVEGQAGPGLVNGSYSFGELFVLGQAGIEVGKNVLLFGSAGFGARQFFGPTMDTIPTLVGGVGVEFAANDFVAFRAEVQATTLGPYPSMPYAYRANFGVLSTFD